MPLIVSDRRKWLGSPRIVSILYFSPGVGGQNSGRHLELIFSHTRTRKNQLVWPMTTLPAGSLDMGPLLFARNSNFWNNRKSATRSSSTPSRDC